MNKKTMKIIAVISILLLAVVLCTQVFAAEGATEGAGFNPTDLKGTPANNINEIKNFGNQIIGVIQAIGIVVSVVVVIVLGIKYMMGSVEEKAEYKKTMLPYIVGAALIFAAATVSSIVMNFFSTTTTTP